MDTTDPGTDFRASDALLCDGPGISNGPGIPNATQRSDTTLSPVRLAVRWHGLGTESAPPAKLEGGSAAAVLEEEKTLIHAVEDLTEELRGKSGGPGRCWGGGGGGACAVLGRRMR